MVVTQNASASIGIAECFETNHPPILNEYLLIDGKKKYHLINESIFFTYFFHADSQEAFQADVPIRENENMLVPIGLAFNEAYSAAFGLNFANNLRSWVVSENVSMSAVNSLLSLLKMNGHDSGLPSDYGTLLKTPRKTTQGIEAINGGLYAHFEKGPLFDDPYDSQKLHIYLCKTSTAIEVKKISVSSIIKNVLC